jgi:GDPmannose 4,6-dehydratase
VWWSNAILFNHESPRRPLTFLSRKVSHAVARISLGLQNSIELGDLSSQRDWGWAPDYARAISLISQQETADDFIVATGVAHSVQDYVQAAFAYVGIENWQDFVTTNPEFIRPTEVKVSVGDASKLKNATGWEPTVSFQEMVGRMVQADIDLAKQEINA